MSIRYIGEGVFLFLGEESRFDSLARSRLWEEIPIDSVPYPIRDEVGNRMDAFGLGWMRGPNQSRQSTGQNERGQNCWAPNKPCGKVCKPTCKQSSDQGKSKATNTRGKAAKGGEVPGNAPINRKIGSKTMIAARGKILKDLRQDDPEHYERLKGMDPKSRDRELQDRAERYVLERRQVAANHKALPKVMKQYGLKPSEILKGARKMAKDAAAAHEKAGLSRQAKAIKGLSTEDVVREYGHHAAVRMIEEKRKKEKAPRGLTKQQYPEPPKVDLKDLPKKDYQERYHVHRNEYLTELEDVMGRNAANKIEAMPKPEQDKLIGKQVRARMLKELQNEAAFQKLDEWTQQYGIDPDDLRSQVVAEARAEMERLENVPGGALRRSFLEDDLEDLAQGGDGLMKQFGYQALMKSLKARGDSRFVDYAEGLERLDSIAHEMPIGFHNPKPYYAQDGLPTLVDPFGAYR